MRALAVAIVTAGFLVVGPPPASAGEPLGDSFVQNGGPFVGYQVLNQTGAGQTMTKGIKPGRATSFVWVVYNGGDTGIVTTTGSGSSQCFRVRYYAVDGNDFTDQVEAGLNTHIEFVSVSFPMRVEIKAKACAAPGSTKTVNLDASRAGTFDRARARVRVK